MIIVDPSLPFFEVNLSDLQLQIEANTDHQVDFCLKKLFHQTFYLLLTVLTLSSPSFSEGSPKALEDVDRVLDLFGEFTGK